MVPSVQIIFRYFVDNQRLSRCQTEKFVCFFSILIKIIVVCSGIATEELLFHYYSIRYHFVIYKTFY